MEKSLRMSEEAKIDEKKEPDIKVRLKAFENLELKSKLVTPSSCYSIFGANGSKSKLCRALALSQRQRKSHWELSQR